MNRPFAIVTGGGTAGHVLPALAIGNALVDLGHAKGEILYVGSRHGQEGSLVPRAGFPLVRLPGRGVRRELSRDSISAVAGLAVGAVGAVLLVARRRPKVVVTVGGYAGLPAAAAAVVLRVPLVVVDEDAVPGLVVRLLAPFARRCTVAWEGSRLPRAVVTGTPVRTEIASADASRSGRAAARRRLALPQDRRVVAIFGGSLGAGRINAAAVGLAAAWKDRSDLAIRHVVGRRDWSSRPPVPQAENGLVYQAVEYEEAMADLLVAADVVVARAGAASVAELTALGRPSVLVPLPGAPGDHQAANASVLAGAGAAEVLADGDCTPDRLGAALQRLLDDPGRLASMASAAESLGRPAAAAAVAAVVEQVGLGVVGDLPGNTTIAATGRSSAAGGPR